MSAQQLEKIYDPKQVEDRWYRRWIEQGLFHASSTSTRPPYCIVIPPPNVTGSLHVGHALNNTLQDILVRWRRMQGYNVLWMPGMDHAGIATQNVVERQLQAEGTLSRSARARTVSRSGLGMESEIRRHDHRAIETAWRVMRLGPVALHDGPWPIRSGTASLRSSLSRRPTVSRRAADQLVPALSDGLV